MNAKTLVQLNNEKRKQLNPENLDYYEKMLLYIRSHLTLSEQQTEEILMELLDHLLEAQAEGKKAEEVFGPDPKAYCDELVRQLPKEKGKDIAIFIGFLFLRLFGIFVAIEGVVKLIGGLFKPVDHTLYLGSALVTWLLDGILILIFTVLIILWLRKSVYEKKTSKLRDFLVIGTLGAAVTAGFILIRKFIPSFGFPVQAGGFIYLIVGGAVLAMSEWISRKVRRTSRL